MTAKDFIKEKGILDFKVWDSEGNDIELNQLMTEYAEAKAKEAVNGLVKTLESIKTAAEGVHTPEEAAAVLHFIRNKSFKALSETYKQSK